MNNLQKFTVVAACTVLGSFTLVEQVKAQETYNQPFEGTVTGTCIFNDISDGNPEFLQYSEVSYEFTTASDGLADFSVLCPDNKNVSVGAPQQISGPAITANISGEDSFVSDSAFSVTVGLGNVPQEMVAESTPTEFDVDMYVGYDAPLVPGNYVFVVPVTFAPI